MYTINSAASKHYRLEAILMGLVVTTMLCIPGISHSRHSTGNQLFSFFSDSPKNNQQVSAPPEEAQRTVQPQKVRTKQAKTGTVTNFNNQPTLVAGTTSTTPIYYGPGLCVYPQYECITVKPGDNWAKLFPNEEQRDLVQRINRTYNYLPPGKVIAVPRHLSDVTLIDLAPFPRTISDHEKQIIVDQDKLAWGAYDAEGWLVKWGPIASGRNRCPDSPSACLTLTGVYRVFSKEDERCKSDVFPIGKGGAKMPYCMYFHKGFALHGSDDIPGFRASHGCVRMFIRDAKWLNLEFVETSNEKNNNMGTKVVVRPVTTASSGGN